MYKKILSLFSILFIGYLHPKLTQDSTYPTIFYDNHIFPKGIFYEEGSSVLTNTHCLIGWDLNDVVLKRDLSFVLAQLRTTLNEQGIQYVLQALTKFSLIASHMLYLTCTNDERATLWGRYLAYCFEKAATTEEKALITHFQTIIQKANVPDEQVIKLIQELNQEGHTSVPLTNMEINLLHIQCALIEKKLLQAITPTDDEIQSLTTTLKLLLHPGTVCPASQNKWFYKPNAEPYKEFLQKNLTSHDYSLFIDDKKENVQAAVAHGFSLAIHFTTAEELENILQALGLLHYL